MALDIGTRLGPYEILARLDAGGMGEIYRARDTRLDRLVAIKILHDDATSALAFERFAREAKAIAALNHPGICAIYDVGTSPMPFLVMELLDGETLHQRLARGPMETSALVDAGLALADALSAAHAKGLLHRDLKPANIVLTPRGPKILDFGLARTIEPAGAAAADVTASPTLAAAPLTEAGVAVGTIAYMSPEQLRGETLDARTDLFSLGLVLYEMATGRRAFAGTTNAMTSVAILHDQPAAPRQFRPELPPRLEQAILTLLEKDRDVRTQTAAELRAELTRITRELPGARGVDAGRHMPAAPQATISTSTERVHVPPASSSDVQLIAGVVRRHRTAATTVVLLVLAAIAAGIVVMRRRTAAGAGESRTGPSIANLTVERLTTTGNAGTPAISPDGNYVAYVETAGSSYSLRVRQVATGSNVTILPPEPGIGLLAPAVTPDGTFVDYLKRVGPQRFELWQVPFLGGAPKHLLDGVGAGVAFSADGRRMAFARDGASNQTEIVTASADGSDARVLATRHAPDVFLTLARATIGWFAPAWSPDGATLAVFGSRPDHGQVVFIDAKTGAERKIVETGSAIPGISLAWLDERTLILSLLDKASSPLQLWLLSYPEGTLSHLTNDVTQYVGLSLTADRSRLATARGDASFNISTSDASGAQWTEVVPSTPAKGPIGFGVAWMGDDLVFPSMASGAWTLDRWHAATRTIDTMAPAGGSPQTAADGSIVFYDFDALRLYKMDANGRTTTALGPGSATDQLTPDGRSFTFITLDAGTPAVRIRPIDSGDARTITTEGVRPGGAARVSPDGRRLAYASFDDQRRPATAVCDFPECRSRQIFPLANPRWMPDSASLSYVDAATTTNVWIQPTAGGAPRPFTHFPENRLRIASIAWSADGRRVAVGRMTITNDIVLMRGLKPTAGTR